MDEKIIENIYNDILEISDINIQMERWLGVSKEIVSSYDEVMCNLFDDNGFDRFIEEARRIKYFDSKLMVHFDKLRVLLNEYDRGDKSDQEIITDLEWIKVTNQASLIINLWNKTRNN